jgi:hypothetical protein
MGHNLKQNETERTNKKPLGNIWEYNQLGSDPKLSDNKTCSLHPRFAK